MPVLEARSLTKRYGRLSAVEDIDLTVERGQVYGLLGPNGSGKTTTMACALGLLRPTSGETRILGLPSARIHETRGRVAALFDDATLVSGLSVFQNLEYAQRLMGHRGGRGPNDVLELVGIGDLRRQRAGALSLGQARRLSIARILLGKPELIVLDEPLSGLDTVGVLEVLEIFRRLHAEGVSLLVSSHRMHELEQVVSHIGILLNGKLVRETSLEDLLENARGRVRILTEDRARAQEVLQQIARLGEVRVVSGDPESRSGELVVELGDSEVGTVNRVLVEAGCVVNGLIPEGVSLHAVFESLLNPAEANCQKESA